MSQYFQNLNYTLANEDTNFELQLLPQNAKHIASVNGSGSRSLPLLFVQPETLWSIDVSPQQLWLSELRQATIRNFEHAEFLKFWGYIEVLGVERKKMFESLSISPEARDYFVQFFERIQWIEPLYQGKWENTFRKLAQINRLITGEEGAGIFSCETLSEQQHYLLSRFPLLRWKAVVAALGTGTVFNALLYKGHFPKPNVADSMFRFYLDSFHKLFLNTLAKENFFLQLCFFGKIIDPKAIPCEGRAEVFTAMKKALKHSRVELKKGDLIDTLATAPQPFDFVSLSDVPSYFYGEREKSFLQDIKKSVRPGGLVVLRSYRHRPENMVTQGYRDVSSRYQEQILKEKVGVYVIEVFERE